MLLFSQLNQEGIRNYLNKSHLNIENTFRLILPLLIDSSRQAKIHLTSTGRSDTIYRDFYRRACISFSMSNIKLNFAALDVGRMQLS